MNYNDWDNRLMTVANLYLDSRNPRIPGVNTPYSQNDLIHELVRHDKVLDLATSIAVDGFFPNDLPIAIKEDNRTVVAEGNRRLAALKVIQNPTLVPDEFLKKAKGISNRASKDDLKKIRVLVAPSRQAANRLIVKRHTRDNIERWSAVQQAQFFGRLVEDGLAPKDISLHYNMSETEVVNFLQANTLYETALAMDLSKEVMAVVSDQRKFPLTTLRRVFEYPIARTFFGLEYDSVGGFKGRIPRSEFEKGFKKLVSDIALNNANTRTHLRKSQSLKEYFGTFGNEAPKKKKGRFKSTDYTKKQQPQPIPGKTTAKPKSTRRSASVIPRGLKCGCTNQRVLLVFQELKKLKIDKHPNATAILLRVLLELSTSNYIDQSGHRDALIKRFTKGKRPAEWYPSLRNQLVYIFDNQATLSINIKGLPLRALHKFSSRNDGIATLDSLDMFIHNKHTHPTEQELRSLWEVLEPLFEFVLKDPPPVPHVEA